MELIYLLYLIIGIALGALGVWFAMRGQVQAGKERIALTEQQKQLEGDALRQQMRDQQETFRQQMQAMQESQQQQMREQRESLQQQIRTQQEAQQQQMQQQKEQMAQQMALLREQMSTTSERVLKERAAELSAVNSEQLSKILNPLQQNLQLMRTQTDNPYALLYSVAVVPAEEDAGDKTITTNFHVGTPQGVTWTSSYSGLTVDGNDAVFTDDAYEGKVTLTAAIDPAGFSKSTEGAGEPLTRKFVLQVSKPITDAINDVKADRQVKAVRYYNMQGVQVMHPESHKGILIQVNDYTDGTCSSQSVVK